MGTEATVAQGPKPGRTVGQGYRSRCATEVPDSHKLHRCNWVGPALHNTNLFQIVDGLAFGL